MRVIKYVMASFVMLLMVICSQRVCAQTVADDSGFVVKVGDQVPDFTAVTVDGDTIEMSELRGKVVMIQFTASWCGVCRRETPFIEKDIWLKHKDNPNFKLLAIDREEPLETVKAYVEKLGFTYPITTDLDASIYKLFALPESGITRNVLVDADGKIVYLTRLYKEAEFAEFVKYIDELVAKRSVEK